MKNQITTLNELGAPITHGADAKPDGLAFRARTLGEAFGIRPASDSAPGTRPVR